VILGVIWSIAAIGTAFNFIWGERYNWIGLILYVGMGWMAIFLGKDFLMAIPGYSRSWLLACGIVYTLGVVFYVWERIPYNHLIWHLFVIGGSVCHYIALLLALNIYLEKSIF
jgi:hemolysin III